MNKFIAIALLAFACQMVVAAVEEVDSQATVVPDDDQEVSQLDSTTQVFSDFCLSTRNGLVKDIKDRTNDKASALFKLFFNNVQVIAQEALDTNKDATEQLSGQLAHPDAQFSEGPNADINSGLSRIQLAQVQPQGFINAFVSNVRAVGNNLVGNVVKRLDDLKQGLTVAEFTNLLIGACDEISAYNKKFMAQFAVDKSEHPGAAFLTYGDVKCMTTQRIARLDAMCQFLGSAKGPLKQIIGQA